MKKVNLILIMAFALMFVLGGLNNVIADEYVCADQLIISSTAFTGTDGKVNGYLLDWDVADDEEYIYIPAYKSSSDQVILKFDPDGMSLVETYNFDESSISGYFGRNGVSIHNGYIYGYNEAAAEIRKIDLGGCSPPSNCTVSLAFTNYHIDNANEKTQAMAIEFDGDSIETPTKIYFATDAGFTHESDRIIECPFSSSTYFGDCNTIASIVCSGAGCGELWGVDYQEYASDQEIIHQSLRGSTLRMSTFDKTTRYTGTNQWNAWIAETRAYSELSTLSINKWPYTQSEFFAGVADITGDGVYIFTGNDSSIPGYPAYDNFIRYWHKATSCETIASGVFVSVNEFDIANNAKATNEGTDFAIYDEEATLGWQAYSFIDTLNNFDGEYSVDGGAFIDITGLQSIGDADAGYETPDFNFTTNYFSYVWDTTTLSNGQYKFKMTATDDDSPPNTDDDTSQEFTICHGDTLQVYLSPDYSTDLYTSLACTNTVTIDVNSTDEIIIKAVNQDSSNPQSLTLNIENSLNDDRFYDVYTSSDGTTWASTPDIDLTRKELKTWTGTTWNHAQTDELSTSETKYYKYVYRKPYAVVTTDIEGYESLIPDDSKIDLWNVAQGDVRFNDQTCIDLLGGSHCTSFVGQSSYSTGAIESTDKLSMVASSTAFDIMLVAKYEINTPGIPKLHVQAKDNLGDAWGDVFVSLNGATAIATGVPMTTTWANYSASMTADSYVRIYIEEGSGAVSDVHMSQIYVVPNKYFTGAPIFRKADGNILDMQPGGDSSSNSEYYLSEGDDFSVHVEYYDKEGVIDTAQIVINKTGSADIVKTVNVTMSPTIEYLYTGDLALGGFIDTSDTITEITGTVYLLDDDSSESFKTTEDVLFRQFPYGAGDYKSGLVIDTGSQFVGRAPKGSVSIQMTRTNPLAKVRMRIWDTDTNGTFSEASSNFVKDFIKGTDFVCSYNDCSFSFDLTGEWVWSNDGKFFVQLEPFFSTSGTQPYTSSFLTVPIIVSQSSYQHMTLTFMDSAMDKVTRHSNLTGDATSNYRDLIAVNNNESKNFVVRLKTSDGANVVGDVNVYLALFKYGNVITDATKGNGTAISEDISAGGTLEPTCRAEVSESACVAVSGCEWFTSGTPSCSTISAPISYYKHEFNAYTGINYFYFSTPLLDESGAYLNNNSNYGLYAYASDQTFTDATLTGKYGNKRVVLSQYIPSDMAVPYSANPLYYVQSGSVNDLGVVGICYNESGLSIGSCALIEGTDWEYFCEMDAIEPINGIYRPGKYRCTWGEQDDQFCDMYETCEVPLLVTSDYAASRPFIYAFACTDPVTGYYSPQCVWAIRGGDTPVTQVDYLIWNDNTNWEESNPDYQQWVKFSIPYEELSEIDINATYIAQLADGPLTMASAVESLFLSAGGVGRTLVCGWGFILSFGANNCNEITINMDTDTLIGTIVNGVQFININDYQQLVKRYEAGFSTLEQCSAVGYMWDSTAGRCYSSVDPTDALKYAGENNISINKSNWFASTYYNQSTQASYNGKTAIVIDDIPSSDTNTTLKIPVNFTMRIWWNDGGEMKSEQRTMKQIVPVNYTNTTACGNYNTLGGWYDKFACLTVDVTTLVTDFFFFFLIMIVLASIIFGAIRATRR